MLNTFNVEHNAIKKGCYTINLKVNSVAAFLGRIVSLKLR